MAERQIKRALISVYDKTGIVDFARALVDEFSIEIISTGGTASLLKENGIPVTLVEQVTGFPEMLDGRVKTLHPKIHAAILADRDNPEHMRQLAEQGIKPIDMVVVNLYPFKKTVADPTCTFEQAIEMIDIGGPCLLRAAAKNHKSVLVICDKEQCPGFLSFLRGELRLAEVDYRPLLASSAFKITNLYDSEIRDYLLHSGQETVSPGACNYFSAQHSICLERRAILRYGENPHQNSAFYRCPDWLLSGFRPKGQRTRGEAASFNNLLDLDSAVRLCSELKREMIRSNNDTQTDLHHCVLIKHNNPCGVGNADTHVDSYRKAYLGDPNAAMGGVLCCSFTVTPEFANVVMETFQRWGKSSGAGGFFLDVWVAPDFPLESRQVIESKKEWGKRVRFFEGWVGDVSLSDREFRPVLGGMVAQQLDLPGLDEDHWKAVTKRVPSESEISDLRLAWLIAKHTKSNAISICKDGMLIGNGAGQMSRVMSCRIATWLAKENGHNDKLPGSVAASDAFFPFPDGPNLLMDAGVTAIIQPGGSKRDAEVIAACDARNVAMIFTGTRHFKH